MERVVLFAKRPRLGQVKTRLVPPLRPEQALALYRALLADSIRLVRSVAAGRQAELCMDGRWTPGPDDPADWGPLRLTEQGPGDLGQRLLSAFRRSRQEGSAATVVVGADSPNLPSERILQAFRHLERGAPGVISPADDGGYVLLGLRDPLPDLFRRIPWGRSEVREMTRRRAAELGLALVELDPWYDVDDLSGLRRLRRDLSGPEAQDLAPATARHFRALDGVYSAML